MVYDAYAKSRGYPEVVPRFYQKGVFKRPYITFIIATTLLWAPFMLFNVAVLGNKPRKSWTLKTCFWTWLLRNLTPLFARCDLYLSPSSPPDLDPQGLQKTRFVRARAVDMARIKGFVRECAVVNNVKPRDVACYLWSRNNAAGIEAQPGDRLVIYVHGGGYQASSAHESDDGNAQIPLGLLKHAKSVDKVLSVDYRLVSAPGPFPAALIDVTSAYLHAIEVLGYDPSRIIVAGNSAGSHCVLTLIRLLRDTQLAPLPAGLVLPSPLADGTLRVSGSMWTNRYCDQINHENFSYVGRRLFKNLSNDIRKNVWISPGAEFLEGDIREHFAGFPPTLITVGDCELLYDEACCLADRLKEAGIDAELYVAKDAIHDVICLNFIQPDKALELLQQVGRWVDARFQD